MRLGEGTIHCPKHGESTPHCYACLEEAAAHGARLQEENQHLKAGADNWNRTAHTRGEWVRRARRLLERALPLLDPDVASALSLRTEILVELDREVNG